MKRVILVAKSDDNTGELGLIIKGATGYEVNSATDGLLIAHDLIEHPTLAGLGRIDDELEALGAIWMCRGRHGELNRTGAGSMHSIEENIASDVSRMYVDFCNGADTIDLCAVLRTRAHDHDDSFREIIAIGRREAVKELPCIGLECADNPQLYTGTLDRYCALALHYMRRGARSLMRRYPGQYAAHSQFWAIAEAVQPYCQPDYEGALYVLRYGYDEREGAYVAYCEESYDDNDY